MSWDLMVQDLPANARSVDEIPADFRPAELNLGSCSEFEQRIISTFPEAQVEPGFIVIEKDDASVEINYGTEEPVGGFMLHVRGGDEAITIISEITRTFNVRVLDISSGKIWEPGESDLEGFKIWRQMRESQG